MQRSVEQRIAIKFCVKLGKTAAETIPMIQAAYKEDALSDRQVFRWHKAFLEGRETVDDEVRAGRPSTSTTDDNVTRVCAKMVPKVLTDDQKMNRLETCQENLNMCESDPEFLNNVITGDASWIFEYDPETKRPSSE
ncbi:putative uncharacterized protein FLJ37770 [Anoplophora glabripennis]|uniref:putative uncharacterized protein FLJ37770 n=1 Tax=Anoplophora glabripennis TaxID=217634 RepID=UPI000C783BF3|nr:putative uncharacterized protein FLJ37770 [Anoplophora glabripennis]